MNDFNAKNNRAVWIDIPVADLDRAIGFYRCVLGIEVFKEQMGDVSFAVLAHEEGNGGCLVEKKEEITSQQGILVYFNAEGRIQDAVAQAEERGGKVLEGIHSIGPHGFRAIMLDSEGNRIALHSQTDE